jgi:hypothetical protein
MEFHATAARRSSIIAIKPRKAAAQAMRRSVLEHSGEAIESRKAFQALPAHEQDCLIEFLKSPQVLPPGTKDLIVDENFS